jgi:hypothetical protein
MAVRFCALLLAASVSMWAAEPIVGDWSGTLKPGNAELRLVLHVKSADGKLTATLDSVDQGVKGIPVDSITYADGAVVFEMAQIQGHYEGKYDAAAKKIAGTWQQSGRDFPLDLEPYAEKAKPKHTGPPAKPSDIDGSWQGKLDANGQTLRVVFNIKTDEDGELTATTDSPDQNLYGFPVTSVKRDGSKLTIEIKALGALYNGTINDAKDKVEGTLVQNQEFPLTLERKKP